MLQTMCNKSTVLVVGAGIHHGGRTALVHVAGAQTGMRCRYGILQHHVIPHIVNVDGGMFQTTLHVLVRGFYSATTSKHHFGVPVHRI